MAEAIRLEIVTPVAAAFSDDVSEVVLPGVLGEMDVMPGHVPLMTLLNAGSVRCVTAAGDRLFAISGGFAEIGPDRVTVMVEHCEGTDDVDMEHARIELSELEKRMDVGDFASMEELHEENEKLRRARARIEIVEKATARR